MSQFCASRYLLFFAALWSLSNLGLGAAWPGYGESKPMELLDPNVRDWGDYSDLPPGIEHGLGLEEKVEDGYNREVGRSSSSLAPEMDFLGDFAGKKRLWVITARSSNGHYLRMMEKQLEEMEQKGLNCLLAERDTYIITIIQNATMEGRIQKTTFQGDATVENLDPDLVTKLLHYLELTNQCAINSEQAFTMLVMKKNLQVSERFPYPVHVEAILELIDQFPMRKLEKITRKGSQFRCKTTKRKIVIKRKKLTPSSQRRGNVTSVVALQRRRHLDQKAALKSKIQEILSGRSRFVIRKEPVRTKTSRTDDRTTSNAQEKARVTSLPSVLRSNEDIKTDSTHPSVEEGKKKHGEKNNGDQTEQSGKENKKEKQRSKKKGKGKKGKKRKGRGKKSSREASEKDKAALKEFFDRLKGTRRLMVISTPSRDATLYTQQTEENRKHRCELALRKITEATIVGQGSDATLTLQHYHLESEPPLSDRGEHFLDSGPISLLRAELGLSSPDLFSMTVTDYDIKPSRVFEAPPSSLALFEYIDNFPSRHPEKEKERKSPPVCSKDMQQSVAENSLLRFMSKRRLLLISAPSEDDYFFQQQLSAVRGQECHLGIRHFAMLKLLGTEEKASGTVELFPLNGRSQTEVESLSTDMVNNMRGQLKIDKDYFSMVVVGKDGDIKAWFPSPTWSLDNIYDLVDSMELRLEEEKLQKRLGIHCLEDKGRGGSEGVKYRGYNEERAEEMHFYHQPKE